MELLNALAKFAQRSPQDRSVMQEALEIAVLGFRPSFRMSLTRCGGPWATSGR